jgi:hypothetical protein
MQLSIVTAPMSKLKFWVMSHVFPFPFETTGKESQWKIFQEFLVAFGGLIQLGNVRSVALV